VLNFTLAEDHESVADSIVKAFPLNGQYIEQIIFVYSFMKTNFDSSRKKAENPSTLAHTWFLIKWATVAFAAMTLLVYLLSFLVF
jgi:hypothetical protein